MDSEGHRNPGWRDRLRALASLDDERRRALYLHVRDAGRPVGRDEAADALGLSRGAAAAHLDRLVDDGVLSASFAKRPGSGGPGSGRPSKFYSAAVGEVAAAVPERAYDLAGELLAAALERAAATGEPVHTSLAAVGREAGERLGRAHAAIDEALDATGYSPRRLEDGAIELGNCPFHRLSRGHREVVCSLNTALLTGAIAACGGRYGLEPLEPGEGTPCCARLVPGEGPGTQG
ncbi:transcriptional regulator [Sinomonas halotolerans]|uniref:Transcriptional regulator n=1 Tax=Sinomonas halotolerans TaxID=1644133 RepID=A0ABU9WWE8_9MICC